MFKKNNRGIHPAKKKECRKSKEKMQKSTIQSPLACMEINFPGLDRLYEVYSELERQIADFKRGVGIECLRKCVICCQTAKFVEASIFEMLPLSLHFWREGRAEEILGKLEGVHPEATCILLNPNPSDGLGGGCSYYPFRPLICRLFGFSATVDRSGHPLVAICKPLKERHSGIADRINGKIRGDLPVPLMPDFSRRAAMIHPQLGQEKYPINIALWEALELVGQKMHFLKTLRGET
jgi:Fe-S-cluster containining protein